MTPRQGPVSDSQGIIAKRWSGLGGDSHSFELNSSAYARVSGFETGTLTEYWRILNRRKGILCLCVLIGTSLGFLITRAQSPVYRARTLVEIESLNEDFLHLRDVSPTAEGNSQSPEYNIRTQIAVMESTP